MHISLYHAALEKITAAPLTLTEKDFDALSAFNPADERRGRHAMRQAQLAILANREPIRTKAIAPRRTAPSRDQRLADSILQIAQAIKARDAKIAALEAIITRQVQAIGDLQKSQIETRQAVLVLESFHPAPAYVDLRASDPRH